MVSVAPSNGINSAHGIKALDSKHEIDEARGEERRSRRKRRRGRGSWATERKKVRIE